MKLGIFFSLLLLCIVQTATAQAPFHTLRHFETWGGSAAAADFNGDGLMDTAGIIDLAVALNLNRGDAVFSSPVMLRSSLSVELLASADFDSNGKADLAVIDVHHSALTLLLNQGDMRFVESGSIKLAHPPSMVAVADVNADGRPDLILADPQRSNSSIDALLNTNGTAFLQKAALQFTGPAAFLIRDFNNDSFPDIALVSYFKNSIDLYKGYGDGRFTIVTKIEAMEGSQLIAAGDFDGDSRPDIATSTHYKQLQVRFNRGNFRFQKPSSMSLSEPAGFLYSVPLDLRKRDCLIAVSTTRQWILQWNGSAWKKSTSENFLGGAGATADFNNDGHKDLFTSGGQILIGNGNGTFQLGIRIAGSFSPVQAADWNRDGKSDLLVRTTSSAELWLSQSRGRFRRKQLVDLNWDQNVRLFDMNSDGLGDLVVNGFSTLTIYYQQPDGTLESPLTEDTHTGLGQFYFADLNHDGIADLVNCGEHVSALLGLRNGGFGKRIPIAGQEFYGSVAFLSDFDHDSTMDLVLANEFFIGQFKGLGNGRFHQISKRYSNFYTESGVAMDFDGDGWTDFVIGMPEVIDVFQNHQGSFDTGIQYENHSEYSGVVTGDFDGDHKPDLASGNIVLLNRSTPGNIYFEEILEGLDNAVLSGDLDGNGRDDLIEFPSSTIYLLYAASRSPQMR